MTARRFASFLVAIVLGIVTACHVAQAAAIESKCVEKRTTHRPAIGHNASLKKISNAHPFNTDHRLSNEMNHHDTSDAEYGYLFTHFTGTDEQVYWDLSDGDDPLNFSPLNHAKPILSSHIGAKAARDSFIAYNPIDDKYFVLGNNQSFIKAGLNYTSAYNQKYRGIVVWESRQSDLTEWSEARLLDIAQESSLHVFSPEAVWLPDKEQFMIYWSGATVSDNVQRIYGAYTKDFKTVSKPFLYYTEGHTGVADLTLLKLSKGKDAWVRFWRSDVHGLQVLGQVSDNGVFGSWRDLVGPKSGSISVDPSGSNEAPIVYKTHNPHKDEFIIWIKGGSGYEAFETENIRVLPYTRETAPYFPRFAEQGQVFSLTKKQYSAIKAKYYNRDAPGKK